MQELNLLATDVHSRQSQKRKALKQQGKPAPSREAVVTNIKMFWDIECTVHPLIQFGILFDDIESSSLRSGAFSLAFWILMLPMAFWFPKSYFMHAVSDMQLS